MRAERIFEHVATSVVMSNAGLVAWSVLDHAHDELTERLETGCLIFFVGELLVRLARHRGAFLRQPWEVFDLLVIGLSLLPALGVDVTLLRVARLGRLARLVHLTRHLSGLRLLRFVRVDRLVPAAAACAAVLLVAGCHRYVAATPKPLTRDQIFLGQLAAAGMTVSDPGNIVWDGHKLCELAGRGVNDSNLAAMARGANPTLTPAEARKFVDIARRIYCPG